MLGHGGSAVPDREVIPGLAKTMAAAREAAALSQQDAGEKSGVHHVSIARFETETRVPTLAALSKLASAYGVNVCDLLPAGHTEEELKPTSKATKPAAKKKGARK